MWTTLASLHMDEVPAKWLKAYKLKHGLENWEQFISAVEQKFGSHDYKEAIESLLELQQHESVEEYVTAFENLQFQITMHNQQWDEVFFVTQFVRGLKPDIRGVVQGQDPTTMARAISLARIQQQVLEKAKAKWSKNGGFTRQLPPALKTEIKQGQAASPLWKERLTRDYRRANGLCYFCAEKYDANHADVCPKRPGAQVNALVVNNLDAELTEEVLTQLAMEDSLAAEFCQMSLNAVTGTDGGEALRVRALVKNKVMLMLIDSGSTHSFVSNAFLDRVGISPVATTPKQVKLANGEVMITDQWYLNLLGGWTGIPYMLI